ncbi:helix-turn-helix domain-containing protein [Streptomyces sp. NPDC058290]|uniref:helix-turn-helix domain-containing protein n=1 Tax=Streptomyces sp. NPDC058290 TaxID=3346426 RepID=UPI0036E60E28
MHLRYSFRIEPTPSQRNALARTFGCARVVYNDALAVRKAAWRTDRSKIPTGELARQVITAAKRTPARAWLADVSVDALRSSLRDLDTAYNLVRIQGRDLRRPDQWSRRTAENLKRSGPGSLDVGCCLS